MPRGPAWVKALQGVAPRSTRTALTRVVLSAAGFALVEAITAGTLAVVAVRLFSDGTPTLSRGGDQLSLLVGAPLGWILGGASIVILARGLLLVRREIGEERVALMVSSEALRGTLAGLIDEDLGRFSVRDREAVRRALLELDEIIRAHVVRPASLIVGESLVAAGLLAFLTVINPVAVGATGVVLSVVVLLLRAVVLAPGDRLGMSRIRRREDALRLIEMFVRAQREIRVSGAGAELVDRVSSTFAAAGVADGRLRVLRGLPRKIIEVSFLGLLLAAAGLVVGQDGLTSPEALSTLVVLVYAAFRVQPSLQLVVDAVGTLRGGGQLLIDALDVTSALHPHRGPAVPSRGRRDDAGVGEDRGHDRPAAISLRRVGVRESAVHGANILTDVDVEVPAGGFVAIVGPSGAGKSTLLDVMVGLRRPDTGEVLVDGAPLSSPASQLWPRAGYVAQSTFVFPGTLRENLLIPEGAPPEAWQRGQQALAAVGLTDVLGEDSESGGVAFDPELRLGEGGRRLSGGESQRLALARALLSSRGLMVLDEALSALDAPSRRDMLIEVLHRERRRTVVLVSHDLANIEDADVIHVLEDGRVTASGSFRELEESSPTFRRLRDGAAAE